jgi:hypothetical protein
VGRTRLERALRTTPVRGRRVRRTVRQVDPWSVLKLALLFHAALFMIVCVATAVLWTGARASGTLDNVEDFITRTAALGNCEPIPGQATTATTEPPATEDATSGVAGDDDELCQAGFRLEGGFKFLDIRILQAFVLGGVVLVLAGTGASVVIVLLFNLMSDVTGGVQLWVVEDEGRARRTADAGSPPARRRD